MNTSVSKFNEIWVIIILVLVIIFAHTAPAIAEGIENISWGGPHKESDDCIDYDNIPKINIQNKEKNERKYYNIFEPYQLSNIFDKLNNSEESEEIVHGNRHGTENFTILENEELKNNLEKIIEWTPESNHLIYFVKANNGHFLENGQLVMLHNLNGSLKEVKSVWYIFVNLDWKFENKWVFKDIEKNQYYSPENNTIIEFDKDCKYSWSKLESESPKYFILIYNF